MKKQHMQLTKEDREYLEKLMKQETLPTRVYRRALGLLELDRGKTITAVVETLQVSRMSLTTWRKRYQAEGLKDVRRPTAVRAAPWIHRRTTGANHGAGMQRPPGGLWPMEFTIVGGQSCRNGFLRKHFAYGGSGHLEKTR